MNFEALLVSLLQSPAFQSLIKSILDNMFNQIIAGVHPTTAAQQATSQAAAAVAFHLTGNPIADIGSLLASLHTPAAAPATKTAPIFTS